MKTFNNLPLLGMLFMVTSCSQFLSHRDYLAEMEHEDSSYFKPNQDFQVVNGDSGRTWETKTERKERTPMSARDLESERAQAYLNQELMQLESKLSDSAMEYYLKCKPRLQTNSEKIYFLKLSSFERKEYMAARGFSADADNMNRSPASSFTQRQSNIILGMTKDDVKNSWGNPSRVEVAGNPSFENERWLYNFNGASKYIYFESGRVGGWE